MFYTCLSVILFTRRGGSRLLVRGCVSGSRGVHPLDTHPGHPSRHTPWTHLTHPLLLGLTPILRPPTVNKQAVRFLRFLEYFLLDNNKKTRRPFSPSVLTDRCMGYIDITLADPWYWSHGPLSVQCLSFSCSFRYHG